MKTQFKITKIDKDIYKIQETWFKEHANFYLFGNKKKSLLIDAGLGFFNIKEFLEKKGFKKAEILPFLSVKNKNISVVQIFNL